MDSLDSFDHAHLLYSTYVCIHSSRFNVTTNQGFPTLFLVDLDDILIDSVANVFRRALERFIGP